jgi:GGDEF domain-containing protein
MPRESAPTRDPTAEPAAPRPPAAHDPRLSGELERARARAEGRAFAVLFAAIDRLGRFDGEQARAAAMRSLESVIAAAPLAREASVWRLDDTLVIALAVEDGKAACALAKHLVVEARKLRVAHGGHAHRVPLSIGLAHDQRKLAVDAGTLLRVAEEGLRVARAGGGDHWAHSELYELFQRQLAGHSAGEIAPSDSSRLREVELPRGEGSPSAGAAAVPALASGALQQALVEKLERFCASLEPGSEARVRLEEELAAIDALRAPAPGAARDANGEAARVELLERRISKLLRALELAEGEIARLSTLVGLDNGIPSIYREVQGLSTEAAFANLKRELMRQIFQANVVLRESTLSAN